MLKFCKKRYIHFKHKLCHMVWSGLFSLFYPLLLHTYYAYLQQLVEFPGTRTLSTLIQYKYSAYRGGIKL
jgi:hypothetical protein